MNYDETIINLTQIHIKDILSLTGCGFIYDVHNNILHRNIYIYIPWGEVGIFLHKLAIIVTS